MFFNDIIIEKLKGVAVKALKDVFGFAPAKEQVVITDWFYHHVAKELWSMSFKIEGNNKSYEIYGACFRLIENGTSVGFKMKYHVNELFKKEADADE